MKIKKSIVVLALFVAGCSTGGPISVSRLGDTPAISGGIYNKGGGITVAGDIREHSGKTLVCGVWAESRHQSAQARGYASRVVSTGSIYLGSERLVLDLLFMRKVAPMADYGGQEANCHLTKRPWQAADANRKITFNIPRQLVAHDVGQGGSGLSVYFKQSGPGAGVE